MADQKISALTPLASPAVGDLMVIVDISAGPEETKSITYAIVRENLFNKNDDDTTDITEGVDKNFVTDADISLLALTSGENTGDQVIPVKATGAEINTGTDDVKFATPKAIEDSDLSFVGDEETLLNKKIQQSATPSADNFTGITISLSADVALALGEVGYIKSDGDVAKADASVIATASGIVIATAAIAQDASGILLLHGVIHLDTMAPGWTVGGIVYLSTTTGAMTQTAPSATDEVIQILGVALASDILYFKPELVQVEHV